MPLHPGRDPVVGLGEDPDRAALEDVRGARRPARPGARAARPGARADHGDALAGEVVVVVPAHRLDHLARELLEAGDVGRLRVDERAERGDHPASGDRALAEGDPPEVAVLVPSARGDLGVEPQMGAEAVLVGAVVGVGLDLGALGEDARPVRVRLERVLVAERGDVDGDVGIVLSRQVPPMSSARSRMTKSSIPACFSAMPAPMPPNPAPTITTSWSGCSRSPMYATVASS